MGNYQTIDDLKRREAALLIRMGDNSVTKETKRHIKRALQRVRKQIKERQ